MTLSEIREELLDGHRHLRALIVETMARAARARAGGELAWAGLVESLARLHAASSAHIVHEEEVLGPVLPTVDAWGEQRAALMDERHRDEECAICEALTLSRTRTERAEVLRLVATAMRALVDDMRREEREILHDSVLRDDIFAIEAGS